MGLEAVRAIRWHEPMTPIGRSRARRRVARKARLDVIEREVVEEAVEEVTVETRGNELRIRRSPFNVM